MNEIEIRIMEQLKYLNMSQEFITIVMMQVHGELSDYLKVSCLKRLIRLNPDIVSEKDIKDIIDNLVSY